MIIIGASGFAKEVLEILHQNGEIDHIAFYDGINLERESNLYGLFTIYKSKLEVENHFNTISNKFILGLGNPKLRKIMFNQFIAWGGIPYTLISNKSNIGHYDNFINEGTIITPGVIITNSVKIGKGGLINLGSTIGHDCEIGDFVEICPNVSISGNCKIGNNVFIGTNATILPGIEIGANAIIAAGAVVNNDVLKNTLVAGIPATTKKSI